MAHPQIDKDYFLGLIDALGDIGRGRDGGLNRPGVSPAERAAHSFIAAEMSRIGLKVRGDQAGNTIGRLGELGQPALMTGSHLDTVANGGVLDGGLGVAASLAAIKAIIDSGTLPPRPLEVIAFANEEGARFGGTFGSRAMTGKLLPEEVYARVNRGPNPLIKAFEEVGLDFQALPQARRSPREMAGYLELHIEQGPVLERMEAESDQPVIGVVTAIPAIRRFTATMPGRADHAGTTPLSIRDDALLKAARFRLEADRILAPLEGRLIANVGRLALSPNAINVVPAQCVLGLELRSPDEKLLEQTAEELKKSLESIDPLAVWDKLVAKAGAIMDRSMIEAVEAGARESGCRWTRMPSGAGHDAASFADLTPTGMIFVSSMGGRSHCPEENSRPEVLLAGAGVLLETLLMMWDNGHI